MKLKVALAKIQRHFEVEDGWTFAVLRNITTGEDLYIGPSWEARPLVLTKVGFTKEEREEEGYEDCDESELHHLGRDLTKQKFLIEEVTDHQWGICFLDNCPVSRLRKHVAHVEPGFDDLKFSV